MQHNIPAYSNPFLEHYMMSPENVSVMRRSGNLVLDIWSGIVAVDTAALQRSGRVDLAIGGTNYDRICADVTIGKGTPRGGYGASHEFGIGIHPESRVPATNWMPQSPVGELVKALAIVNSMS